MVCGGWVAGQKDGAMWSVAWHVLWDPWMNDAAVLLMMMLGLLGCSQEGKQREADRQRHGSIPRPNPSVVENTCSCPVLFKTVCSAVCLFAESGFSKANGPCETSASDAKEKANTPKFLAGGRQTPITQPTAACAPCQGLAAPQSIGIILVPLPRTSVCFFVDLPLASLSMITSKARAEQAKPPNAYERPFCGYGPDLPVPSP